MEKRPLLLRSCITVFVIALFIIGMYPLRERDYYQVFMEMLKTPGDKEAAALVEDAKKLKEKNPQLFQSQVLLQAAEAKNIDLTKKVKGEGLLDNRDVMSLIRKNASGSIRLGLDLAGGVEFYLELVPDEGIPPAVFCYVGKILPHGCRRVLCQPFHCHAKYLPLAEAAPDIPGKEQSFHCQVGIFSKSSLKAADDFQLTRTSQCADGGKQVETIGIGGCVAQSTVFGESTICLGFNIL